MTFAEIARRAQRLVFLASVTAALCVIVGLYALRTHHPVLATVDFALFVFQIGLVVANARTRLHALESAAQSAPPGHPE